MAGRPAGASHNLNCSSCDSDAAFLRATRPAYEAITPTLRVVDLFSGFGGLSLGVAEAARRVGLGIDIPLAVDLDQDAVAVYGANFPGADVRLGHVEELIDGENGSALTAKERRLARRIGAVDVLVGGPPCQGHSDLNNHTRREDPRNALYARMARAARVLRPALVLIENVPTVQHDTNKVVDVTIHALEEAGYAVDHRIVDLTSLGAPQRRRRHVVLAFRHPEGEPAKVLDGLQQRCTSHPLRTVRWAIEDLLDSPRDGMYDTASTPSAKNLERMNWLFVEDRYDLPNWLRPDCHASDHSYNSMYGRLAWDAPAQTVTTGFGSMGQGRYVHPARPRTITPHEAARLQMIPDFVDFSSVRTRGSLARLIGNAVPPVLASAICELALPAIGHRITTPPDTDGLPADAGNEPKINAGSNGAPSQSRRSPPAAPSHAQAGVPAASSDAVRRRMQATRQKDTKAERKVQRELDRLQLVYAVDVSPVEGSRRRADIVFADVKVAVYVDGCFWHGCPIHGTSAKSNAEWWHEKLKRNRERDHETSHELQDHGWSVLRFWEHEDPAAAAATIQSVVSQRRGRLAQTTATRHSGQAEA